MSRARLDEGGGHWVRSYFRYGDLPDPVWLSKAPLEENYPIGELQLKMLLCTQQSLEQHLVLLSICQVLLMYQVYYLIAAQSVFLAGTSHTILATSTSGKLQLLQYRESEYIYISL